MPHSHQKSKSPVTDTLYTIRNFMASLDGRNSIWFRGKGNWISENGLAELSPEDREKLLTDYRGKLGLDNLPGEKAFETYTTSGLRTVAEFSEVKVDGQPISQLLSAQSDAATEASQGIAEALQLTTRTGEASQAFTDKLTDLKTLIDSTTKHYPASQFVDYLYDVRNEAILQIKEQQKAEKTALEAKFQDENFKNAMKHSCNCDDAKLNKIKLDMFSTLDTKHAEQLTQFEKDINEPIEKMHAAQKVEDLRVVFLAQLYENKKNTAFRDEINRLHELHLKEQARGVSVEITETPCRAIFDGIKLTDLTTIESCTGKKLTAGKDGSFSMELPNRLMHSLYYHSSQNYPEADIMSIPQALRACGYTKVTMTVEHKNQEHAMELGRAAYAACLKSGFPDDKTTIKVNGKDKTAAELFADCPSRLQAIRHSVASSEAAATAREKQKTASSASDFKTEMTQIKTKRESEAEVQQPAPPGIAASG
jgi:hypothetical protein